MSVPIPDLDNRTFEELVEEARRLVPVYAPQWTDHNLHDPGITFIELFAWLTEMQLYTFNQVSDRHLVKYLELLGVDPTEHETLEDAFKAFRLDLRVPYRAVISSDYEFLALQHERVARAKAVVTGENSVRIVIVPEDPGVVQPKPLPDKALLHEVCKKLDAARLITTSIEIAPPDYVNVSVGVTITIKKGFEPSLLKTRVNQALNRFLSPLKREPQDNAWPFGRPVYRSEVYKLVEGIEGVDCVPSLALSGMGSKFQYENGDINITPQGLVYPGTHRVEIMEGGGTPDLLLQQEYAHAEGKILE
jgi:hypothetical protein